MDMSNDADVVQSLLAQMAEMPDGTFPDWEDASDLSRLHVQAFATEMQGGIEYAPSRGSVRVTGDGVHEHAIDLEVAGQLLSDWQHLVTSVGASCRGKKSLGGRLPDEIVRDTRLSLTAPALPGSVILEFAPTYSEVNDRASNLFNEPGDPLVAESVRRALDVIGLAAASSDFSHAQEALKDLGPRVASAALQLAENVSGASLNLNLVWEEPGQPRRRSAATATQLKAFARGLKQKGLDGEPETLQGTLRTISDHKKIDISVADPEAKGGRRKVSVDRGDVDFREFRIGDFVGIDVEVKITLKPGGVEVRKYRAQSVRAAKP